MNQKESLITRIHFIGKPGSGKDTQAEEIKKLSPLTTDIISTGDYFRGATSPDGKYGQYYEVLKPHINNIENGQYIPDDIIVRIVNTELIKSLQSGFTTLIYTGYPRTLGQLNEINKANVDKSFSDLYIYCECPTEIARNRVLKRAINDSLVNQTRKEDNPKVFSERMKVFNKFTIPIVRELKRQKRLITIDATGTIKEVAQEIKEKVQI